jgi:hypothetical protein
MIRRDLLGSAPAGLTLPATQAIAPAEPSPAATAFRDALEAWLDASRESRPVGSR